MVVRSAIGLMRLEKVTLNLVVLPLAQILKDVFCSCVREPLKATLRAIW